MTDCSCTVSAQNYCNDSWRLYRNWHICSHAVSSEERWTLCFQHEFDLVQSLTWCNIVSDHEFGRAEPRVLYSILYCRCCWCKALFDSVPCNVETAFLLRLNECKPPNKPSSDPHAHYSSAHYAQVEEPLDSASAMTSRSRNTTIWPSLGRHVCVTCVLCIKHWVLCYEMMNDSKSKHIHSVTIAVHYM